MSFERFDDEVRQREKNSYVTLSDGRRFSHRFIFDTYFRSGLKESFMKEALYRLITNTKFAVKFEDSNLPEKCIVIDDLLAKPKIDRKRSVEVKMMFDEVQDNCMDFSERLLSSGTVIKLNR